MMKLRVAAALLCLPFLAVDASHAQLGGIGRAIGSVAARPLAGIVNGPQPVSTNIRDATFGDPSKDRWAPRVRMQSISALQRNPAGGFVLQPGYYGYRAQSYCLHAGTHGPGGGDGYLYAPVLGSARDAVQSILRNSANHPDIAQHDIQLLLWAIVARARFEDLSPQLKLVAGRLLTTRQLASLNRNALSVLNSGQLQQLGLMPPFARQVLQAESDLRGMLTSGASSYADMERTAVLAGMAPRGEGSIDTPSGRWSAHPDGYWVRYIPSGYSNTQLEIWVEPGSAAVGRTFDPATHIAVPGNTSRQRLAQSARIYGS